MEGRTANAIKNHYNQNLKKRVSPGEFLKPSDMPENQREDKIKPFIAPSTLVQSFKAAEVSTPVKEKLNIRNQVSWEKETQLQTPISKKSET